MSDRFRIEVVSRLVEEINLLTGGAFEQFGYKVMPLIQPGHWSERGTTIEGAPRKSTIDTSASAAEYAAEMSSFAGYFDEGVSKPKGDLQHVLEQHPHAKRIWLLSSRTQNAGRTKDIENLASEFKRSHPSVESVTILDARQIADQIFDHIDKDATVRSLSPYLPILPLLAERVRIADALF